MKFKTKIAFFVLIAALTAFALSACAPIDESIEAKALCEEFVGYVVAEDYNGALNMVKEVAEPDDFDNLWKYMRDSVDGADSFEIKQLGWNKRLENGFTYTSVTFEIVTDNGKICHAELQLSDDHEGIFGFLFLDSTEFVESTRYVSYLNIALKILSAALFGITVWAFVDCLRRRTKNKVLWAVFMLVSVGISVAVGPENLALDFSWGIIFSNLAIVANRLQHTVITTVQLPVGVIAYLIMRKRLVLDAEKTESAAPQQPEEGISESLSDISSDEEIDKDNEGFENGNPQNPI